MSTTKNKRPKMKLQLGKRIPVLLTLFFAVISFGIDFILSQRLENLLSENQNQFTVQLEADLCNALTNKQYFGTRVFLNKVIEQKIQSYELLDGDCNRGMLSSIKVTKKPQ